jgi:hypothetical protein
MYQYLTSDLTIRRANGAIGFIRLPPGMFW